MPQVGGRVKLGNLAGVHDADAVVADNGAQAVGNAQQRLAAEARRHGALNLVVRLHVDAGRGLVADDDLRAAHERAREGHQLALAEREVEAVLLDDAVEVDARRVGAGLGELDARGDQVGLAQGGPQRQVGVLVEGVEVGAHRALEQRRVLRDDGEARAQVAEANGGYVDAVNGDGAARDFYEAEQSAHDGRLACARAPDDAHALAAGNVHRQLLQHQRQVFAVAHLDIVKDDFALFRPAAAHVHGVQRRLLVQAVAVVAEALDGVHAVFDFCQLADSKLQHLHNGEDITEHQATDGRRHAEARRDDEDADGEDQGVADEIKADGQPALVGKGEVVRGVHLVNGVAQLVDEAVAQSIGADGRDAAQAFAELGKHARSQNRLVSLDFTRRRAVVRGCANEENVQRHQGNGEIVEIGDDEDEDGTDHAEGEEVHADRIRQVVVHDVDVSGEAVGDAAQRRRVEKGHGCTENAGHGVSQHDFTGIRAQDRQEYREEEHEDGLHCTQAGVDANVGAGFVAKLVRRPPREPQAGDNVGALGQDEQEDDERRVENGAGRADVGAVHRPRDRSLGALLALHECRRLLVLLVLLPVLCRRVNTDNLVSRLGVEGFLLFLLLLFLDGRRFHQGAEPLVVLHEVVKGVDRADLAAVHPDDAVAAVEHPQLMRREDAALVLEQAEDGIVKDVAADVGIDGAEGVVHQDNVGVKINGAGNVEALLLAARNGDASFADLSLVAVGKHVQIGLEGTTI